MRALIGILLIPLALLMACAESSAIIKESGASTRTDVFQEVSVAGAVPSGYADVLITASLKTHQPRAYSATDPHGTRDYQLLLNVDGQTIVLNGAMQAEKLPVKDLKDPEAGAGIRYRFRKMVRLKAGTHRIVVSLPADNIALSSEVTLHEGRENTLVLEPVYGTVLEKKRPSATRVTGFQEGINRIIMTLNGRQI